MIPGRFKPFLRSPVTLLALAVGTGSLFAQLDASWTVTVNGQTALVSSNGSFHLPNIAAHDQFGVTGPGSPPDGRADDFARLLAMSATGGVPRYATSESFQLRRGAGFKVNGLAFSDVPPRLPESLAATPDAATLTSLGQITQVRVVARHADGTTIDVTARASHTTYRTSNRAIAAVDSDGRVTATGSGVAFITALNEGAATVTQIQILAGGAAPLPAEAPMPGSPPDSGAGPTPPPAPFNFGATLSVGITPGTPGQISFVPLSLRRATNAVAAQFDVTFDPVRVSAGDALPGSPFPSHVVRSRELAPGLHRVLVYSRNNAPFPMNGFEITQPFQLASLGWGNPEAIPPANVMVATANATAVTPLRPTPGAIFVRVVNLIPGGSAQFFFPSNPDQSYLIQTTTNFSHWMNLFTNVATGDFLEAIDTGAAQYPFRFYRSVTNFP